MQPKQLTPGIVTYYTTALEKVRRLVHRQLSSYKEPEIDDVSWPFIAWIGEKVIGAVRIKPYPFSPVHDFTKGKALPSPDEFI